MKSKLSILVLLCFIFLTSAAMAGTQPPVTNNDLQAQLNVIQKDVKTVDGKVSSTLNQANSIKNDVGTINNMVVNVDSKVTTANNGINDIKAQLNQSQPNKNNYDINFIVFDADNDGDISTLTRRIKVSVQISNFLDTALSIEKLEVNSLRVYNLNGKNKST